MSPENDRYIRTGNERWTGVTPFDPLAGLDLEWRESKKGNQFVRARAFNHEIVVTVTPSRYHEGEWVYSFVLDDGGWETHPERFESQEDAKEAALAALRSMVRALRSSTEPAEDPQAKLTESTDIEERPISNDPPPPRRIRL